MFESLEDLPLDSNGHLYLAFDLFCRDLWKPRTGRDDVKACYSFNQASFPRADPGEFYNFFQRKELDEIKQILERVDSEPEEYSHETFMIWHTAIRFLGTKQRYGEMEYLVRRLCMRVYRLGSKFDYHQARQLNYDSMLSFYLLGDTLEKTGHLHSAKVALENSVELRNQIVPIETWDAGKANSLNKLEAITTRLEDSTVSRNYVSLEDRMYFSVGIRDGESRL